MTYAQMLKQAQRNNATKAISSIYKKEWKKGETIVGRLVSISELLSERFQKPYYSYLFNTDAGNIKTALGAGVDQEVRPFMTIGHVYAVTYQGEIDTGKGNPMKDFAVVYVPSDEDEVRSSEDSQPELM